MPATIARMARSYAEDRPSVGARPARDLFAGMARSYT